MICLGIELEAIKILFVMIATANISATKINKRAKIGSPCLIDRDKLKHSE